MTTASRAVLPILEVINAMGLTDTVVVVTRYFGGVLLGTGGLVRAYTEAAKAGLAKAGIAVMRYGFLLLIHTDYTDLGRIQYFLGNRKIPILDSQYADRVSLKIRVPREDGVHRCQGGNRNPGKELLYDRGSLGEL